MTTMRSINRDVRLAAVVAVAGLCGAAWAEPPADAPLKGPRVVDNRAPGAEGNFGADNANRRPGLEPRLDVRSFRQAMKESIGPDAADGLRATPEQREKIERVIRAYTSKVRDYMDAHRDELRDMRPRGGDADDADMKQAPRERREGRDRRPEANRPDTGGKGLTQAERERFKEIMQGAPKPAEMINQVWQVLSAEQKAAVESRLSTIKSERNKDRDERMLERKIRERRGEVGGGSEDGVRKDRRRKPGRDPSGEPKSEAR